MKKKIIFITIESVKRELDSKTLLALKALKRNYRVVIGQKGALREFIKDTNPGIMILKSFGPKNTTHIDFIKKNNFKIVSSDEELVTAVDFEDKVEYRLNNENLSKLDIYLCIGETSDYPILKKKFNSIIKNVLVCGNIRLELLKKNYRKLLEKDSEVLKNKFGKYILFFTGFAHINKYRVNSEIDFIYSRIVNENIDPDSHHIYLINEQVKMQREILLQSLKFLNNFEKNFPGINLVISPHPNEKIEFWENYINKKKFKNIFINKDIHSSSYSLINSSEMLISCNSTSLLEAFFLKKKVINLLGKKTRVSEIELLKKITKVVRSSDELSETIKDLEKTENKKIFHQELKEIKNFEENFDSFKAILDKLDKLENVDLYNSLFKNNYHFVISQFRKYKNYIKWIISSIIHKNALHHILHQSKIGARLKKNFFINNTNHINSLEKVENLKIKQIVHEVFLLDSLNKF